MFLFGPRNLHGAYWMCNWNSNFTSMIWERVLSHYRIKNPLQGKQCVLSCSHKNWEENSYELLKLVYQILAIKRTWYMTTCTAKLLLCKDIFALGQRSIYRKPCAWMALKVYFEKLLQLCEVLHWDLHYLLVLICLSLLLTNAQQSSTICSPHWYQGYYDLDHLQKDTIFPPKRYQVYDIFAPATPFVYKL